MRVRRLINLIWTTGRALFFALDAIEWLVFGLLGLAALVATPWIARDLSDSSHPAVAATIVLAWAALLVVIGYRAVKKDAGLLESILALILAGFFIILLVVIASGCTGL